MSNFQQDYNLIRGDGVGFHRQKRGLFEVSGGEAVQFLNGLITNDVAKLEDGAKMRAAFPTVKGRLFAVVRVMRRGDKFLFETEEATRQKVYDNLFRFTFAGDFHLKDLSDEYEFFRFFGSVSDEILSGDQVINFQNDYLIPVELVKGLEGVLIAFIEISDQLYEVLRIEEGIPVYGVDMDEETVVPEVNFNEMISYEKGCYIGQEVIARIHFRGKVAKQLMGLEFDLEPEALASDLVGAELKSKEDKNAGKITSVVYSPKLGKTIALGYVRNAFLEFDTELLVGKTKARVRSLPFILNAA